VIHEGAEARFARAEVLFGLSSREVLHHPKLTQRPARLIPSHIALAMYNAKRAVAAAAVPATLGGREVRGDRMVDDPVRKPCIRQRLSVVRRRTIVSNRLASQTRDLVRELCQREGLVPREFVGLAVVSVSRENGNCCGGEVGGGGCGDAAVPRSSEECARRERHSEVLSVILGAPAFA